MALLSVSRRGQATTYYEYDADTKELARTGLDVNASGTLTLASTDRITDTVREYQNDSGTWWYKVTTKVYPTDSDATPLITYTRDRLTGLTAPMVSQRESYDAKDDASLAQRDIDRAAKLVTDLQISLYAGEDDLQYTYNGRLAKHVSQTDRRRLSRTIILGGGPRPPTAGRTRRRRRLTRPGG